MKVSARRLRIGVALWILSWFPIPIVLLGAMVSGHVSTGKTQAIYWGCCAVMWVIGVIGIFLAGKETIIIVKARGARKAPGAVWHILRTGTVEDSREAATQRRRS